jgi:SAM-dependent methyltransferase
LSIRAVLGREKDSRNHPSKALLAHYRKLFERYGPGHNAVQWSSLEAQQRRFNVLADLVDAREHVLDVGCGLGDMLPYLREQHEFTGDYTGLDQVPAFIDYARERYSRDVRASFQLADVAALSELPACDCVLISGLFNNQLDARVDNTEWLRTTIRLAFSAARRAVAFNALSTWVGREDSGLFYVEPDTLAHWCAEHLTRRLILRHDYNAPAALGVPVDFTICLFKG